MKQYEPPFEIEASIADGNSEIISCTKFLRGKPDHNVTCIGKYQGRAAVIKVFFNQVSAQKEWEQESNGTHLLIGNNLYSPKLSLAGKDRKGPGHFIVLETRSEPVTFKDLIRSEPDSTDDHIFKIISFIAKMHQSGIYFLELQTDNFLMEQDEAYCINTDSVKKNNAPLADSESIKNIALFVAHLGNNVIHSEKNIWQEYCRLRGDEWGENCYSEYEKEIENIRINLAETLLRKLYKNGPEYIFDKNFKKHFSISKLWFVNDKKGKLNNLEKLFSGKNINYLKQGGSSTVIKIKLNNKNIIIKRYNIKNIVHGLKRAFRRTRASRSWAMGHLLNFYGIPTPEPIAFFENRVGPIRRTSYFICEHIEGPSLLEYFSDENSLNNEQKNIANQVISIFRNLKKSGIYHSDMKATNLIVHQNKVYLFDLDGASWFQDSNRALPHHKKDISRFLRNWKKESEVYKYFSKALETSQGS